jgi:Leucine-rich repeat (LRR) protein
MRVLILCLVILVYSIPSGNQTDAMFVCAWSKQMCSLIRQCQTQGTDMPCIGNYTGTCCLLRVTSDKWYLIIISPSTQATQPAEISQDHINFMLVNLQQHQLFIVGIALVDCPWCTQKGYMTVGQIIQFPDEICQMSKLEFIFLGLGQWSIDSPCFNNMKKLQFLGILGYGSVETIIPISDLLSGLPLLLNVHLEFRGSRVFCRNMQPSDQLFSMPVPLLMLELANFYSQEMLPANLLHGLTALLEISLRGNTFRSLHSNMFSGVRALRMIDLRSNCIQFIPLGLFDGLLSLVSVDFRGNQINYLSSDAILPLLNVATIKFIDLSNNRMARFHWNWDRKSSAGTLVWLNYYLKYYAEALKESYEQDKYWDSSVVARLLAAEPSAVLIQMQGNRLNTLEDIISGLAIYNATKHSYYISVYGHAFVCSCSDFNYFFQSNHPRLIDVGVTSCMSPDDYYRQEPLLYSVLGNFFSTPRQNFSSTCPIASSDCPPQVNCYIDLNNNSVSISTKDRSITKLPNNVPKLPQFNQSWNNFITSYYINCSHGAIKTLESALYLTLTSVLDLSFNELSSISDSAARQLQFAHTIILNDNHLTTLPLSFRIISSNVSLRELHLYNNPWSCDCHSAWMKHWLANHSSAVVNRNLIKCVTSDIRNDMLLMDLDDSMFRCGYILSDLQYTMLMVGGVCVCVVLITAAGVLLIHIKRHWIYATFRLHPFDRDECVGEDMLYDVFLSYANEDEAYVTELITWLERDNNFVACYHSRNFVLGVSVIENVERAVTRSKRTICYLTDNFLKSEWCIWEFTMALNFDLANNRHRLIVIKDDQLLINSITNASIKAYMQRFTFIEQTSAYFNELLLYSLPQTRSRQNVESLNAGYSDNETTMLMDA